MGTGHKDERHRGEPPDRIARSGEEYRRDPSWGRKFSCALVGLKRGLRGQSSFFVHLFAAAAVAAAGLALSATRLEWCLLVLCIATVLTAEMFNTSLESLARAVDRRPNDQVGQALDMASAAVLLASGGAAFVGALILGHRLAVMLGWIGEG